MTDIAMLRVLADNPADIDLLGLSPIAAAVKDIVCADNAEPVTVGIHGPWGSGKSSLLRQICADLTGDDKTVTFELNPWEFADDDDVKSTIITTVLSELALYVPPEKLPLLRKLARRVSWKRATSMLAKGALTLTGEPLSALSLFADVLDTMSETDDADGAPQPPANLTGFKAEFAEILQQIPQDRVVILVDDLDRCLPTAVLSTLEAIKLFLAVPKMAFVIAADQQMVREAIAAGLGETRRSAIFARDYLDKIVQVPITVPQPTRDDAESYVALMLAHRTAGKELDLGELSRHTEQRRASGLLPYLAEASNDLIHPGHLAEAKLIVAGLGTDDVVSPRRMKRFVNALAVRNHAAARSGIDLDPDVIAKLFMLEHRFLPQMNELAVLRNEERTDRLKAWEAWSRDAGEGQSPGQPEEDLRTFFAAEPYLSDRDIDRYFVLARKLLNADYAGGLGDQAVACLEGLLSTEPLKVEQAGQALAELPVDQATSVVEELITRLASSTEPDALLAALVVSAAHGVEEQRAIDAIRSRRAELKPAAAAKLAYQDSPKLQELTAEFANDTEIPELTRKTLARAGQ